jgi:hypothetical protein
MRMVMMMVRLRAGLPLLLAALCVACAAPQPGPLAVSAPRLADWWAGEWNNHEQTWQNKIDLAKPDVKPGATPQAVPHVHTVVALVTAPALGASTLYVQRAAGDDLKRVQGQWLMRLKERAGGDVAVDMFAVADGTRWVDAHQKSDAFIAMRESDVRPLPECAATLRFDAATQTFTSSQARPASCTAPWPGSLGAARWTHDEASSPTALQSRKARYFQGWLWFRNAGPSAAADTKDTSFTARYLLHAEGQRMTVLHKDGTPSPYSLELAQLTYQNTSKPVLKLALLDRASGKTLSYVWANPEAQLIGLNLGWFQAGVTQKPERTYFGY